MDVRIDLVISTKYPAKENAEQEIKKILKQEPIRSGIDGHLGGQKRRYFRYHLGNDASVKKGDIFHLRNEISANSEIIKKLNEKKFVTKICFFIDYIDVSHLWTRWEFDQNEVSKIERDYGIEIDYDYQLPEQGIEGINVIWQEQNWNKRWLAEEILEKYFEENKYIASLQGAEMGINEKNMSIYLLTTMEKKDEAIKLINKVLAQNGIAGYTIE